MVKYGIARQKELLAMNSITFPDRKIIPRLEFPAWLRHGRARVANMLAPLGGMLTPLGVNTVAQNWWSAGGASGCLAAYQPKGAASLAASYVNLANAGTYDAAPGVAPTLSGGWVFNGTTQYLKTGIVPLVTYTMIIQFASAATTTFGAICGCAQGGSPNIYYQIVPTLDSGTPGKHAYGCGSEAGTGNQVAPKLASGNLCLAGAQGYLNGAADGVLMTPGATVPAFDIYIGARNVNNALQVPLAATVIAMAIYSGTLTAPQVAAVAAAMAAL